MAEKRQKATPAGKPHPEEREKGEDEPRPRGWFRRNLPGIAIGVAVTLVGNLIWFGVPRLLPHHPADKRVGDPVTLGNFTYTVRGVDCGPTQFGQSTAHGKFCVLTVWVVNNTRDADSPFPSEWFLEVGDLHFDPREWSGLGFARLFPGEGEEGQIAFDVPSESSPTALVIAETVQGFLAPAEEHVRIVL